MATDERSLLFNSATSDATFRDWVGGISSALQQAGLAKTLDTGQIDLAAHVRTIPVNAEAIQGYEMFRFNDALQASAPIFVKIEYGYNTTAQPIPALPVMHLTVGTGTNGAGTLTGVVTSRRKIAGPDTAVGYNATGLGTGIPNSVSPVWTFGDGSSVAMCIGAQTTAQWTMPMATTTGVSPFPAIFGIERSRNSDGTPNGDGAVFMTSAWLPLNGGVTVATVPTTVTQMISFLGAGIGTASDQWPIGYPGNVWATAATGQDLYTFPMRLATPKAGYAMSFLGTFKSDLTFGITTDVTLLGVTPHRFRSLCRLAGTATDDTARAYVSRDMQNTALLMRWE